jgi:hypothetical protein
LHTCFRKVLIVIWHVSLLCKNAADSSSENLAIARTLRQLAESSATKIFALDPPKKPVDLHSPRKLGKRIRHKKPAIAGSVKWGGQTASMGPTH